MAATLPSNRFAPVHSRFTLAPQSLIGSKLDATLAQERHSQGAVAHAAERQNILKNAIIEGEAYALGFKGHLGSFAVMLSGVKRRAKDALGKQSDLLDRLARSFGGARTDLFIANRLLDVHTRVATALISKSPRRGFDAIVAALWELQPDLGNTDDEAAVAVAHFLEASPEDQVVRNIVARLKALQAQGTGRGGGA